MTMCYVYVFFKFLQKLGSVSVAVQYVLVIFGHKKNVRKRRFTTQRI